jgi:hypothetical protein
VNTLRWVFVNALSPLLVLAATIVGLLTIDPSSRWFDWCVLASSVTAGTLVYAVLRAFSPTGRARYLDNVRSSRDNFLLHVVTIVVFSVVGLIAWWWFATPLGAVLFWMSFLVFWYGSSLLHDVLTLCLARLLRLDLNESRGGSERIPRILP